MKRELLWWDDVFIFGEAIRKYARPARHIAWTAHLLAVCDEYFGKGKHSVGPTIRRINSWLRETIGADDIADGIDPWLEGARREFDPRGFSNRREGFDLLIDALTIIAAAEARERAEQVRAYLCAKQTIERLSAAGSDERSARAQRQEPPATTWQELSPLAEASRRPDGQGRGR